MGTNTGNGGFEIDGKTYTFDQVEPGEDGSAPVNADSGDVKVDNDPKDIGETVKVTIGQYLNRRTTEEKNDYTVDRSQEERSISSEKGYPVKLGDHINSSKFSTFEGAKGQVPDSPDLKGNANQKIDDPATKIAFQKGKSDAGLDNGHDVLPSVQKNTLPASINPYVSSVLSNNRFSDAATRFAGVNLDSPGGGFDPTLIHPEFGEISTHRMAQVGVALSIRASAELNAANNGNNPTSFGAEAKALLPSFNQLGASRVDLVELEARDVLRTLTGDEIPSNVLTDITPGGSWGSLNNVHDQFSGINALGMIALSIALTAAVLLLFTGLAFIVDLIGGEPAAPAINDDGIFALGRSSALPQANPNAFPPDIPPDIAALIGIRPTVNPFAKCLESGTASFFGIDNSGGLLGTITSGLTSATENPGFNSIIARTIIRAGVIIIDSFKDIGGNPLSIVQGILSVIDTIRSSKLIGAMNVFATLGDTLLVDEESNDQVNKPGEPVKKSKIDNLPDNSFASAVSKNRLKESIKLAWANNRAPAAYLLPDAPAVMNMLVPELGGPANIYGLVEDKAKVLYKRLGNDDIESKGARIPYDGPDDITVKKVEAMLEAEYMPFYFHDLRTNEIISFHAFLTALTDDFAANWESTEAFGRVDPVRIYKNTTRRISMGWYIVSTSEEDFNDMWFKINKLVTLVYPQYTQGRIAATEDNVFVQPFSQLQGASPLVRLRLGDLLRSNYSRFALARLFGADHNVMKLGGEDLSWKDSEVVIESLREKLEDAKKNPADPSFVWSISSDVNPIVNQTGFTISLPSIPGIGSGGTPGKPPDVSPVFRPLPGHLKFFKIKVVNQPSDKQIHFEPSIMNAGEISKNFGINETDAKSIEDMLKRKYGSSDNKAERMIGAQYVGQVKDLVPSFEMFEKFRNEVAADGGVSQAAIDALNNFMNPDNNAIVRAFQSTRGKGLAGTIDTINFDFYDNVTWDIKPGRRAPQFLKVSITFTPIHDISPGIDHQGFNRAPVYPVGHLAHTFDRVKEND